MHQIYKPGRAVGTQRNANKAKQAMASAAFPRPNMVVVVVVECKRGHDEIVIYNDCNWDLCVLCLRRYYAEM